MPKAGSVTYGAHSDGMNAGEPQAESVLLQDMIPRASVGAECCRLQASSRKQSSGIASGGGNWHEPRMHGDVVHIYFKPTDDCMGQRYEESKGV